MDCPYINANDSRCNLHLNMQHLEDAFEHCTGNYGTCPLYQELSGVMTGVMAMSDSSVSQTLFAHQL